MESISYLTKTARQADKGRRPLLMGKFIVARGAGESSSSPKVIGELIHAVMREFFHFSFYYEG